MTAAPFPGGRLCARVGARGTHGTAYDLSVTGERDLLTVLSGRERTVRMLDDIRAEVGDNPDAWMPRLVGVA